MNWNDLTMAQKNELMQTYIRNGVTSLDDMRSHFNLFADGGPKGTPPPPDEEEWITAKDLKPIPEYPQSGAIRPLGDDYVQYIPIIGTTLDIGNAITTPTTENMIQAGSSILLDALSLGIGSGISKLAKPTGKAVQKINAWDRRATKAAKRKANYRVVNAASKEEMLPYYIIGDATTAPMEYISNHPELWPNNLNNTQDNYKVAVEEKKHNTTSRHYALGGLF